MCEHVMNTSTTRTRAGLDCVFGDRKFYNVSPCIFTVRVF